MGDVVYQVLSLLVVIFNIVPLCWQLEHRNSGPVMISFWVVVLNLTQFASRRLFSREQLLC